MAWLVEPKEDKDLMNVLFFSIGAIHSRDENSSYSKCLTSVAPRIAVCRRDLILLRRENANCRGNNVWSCPFGQSCSGWWTYTFWFMTSGERKEGGLKLYEVTCWIRALPSPHLSFSSHPSLFLPPCHAVPSLGLSMFSMCLLVVPVWQTTIFVGLFSIILSFPRSLITIICSAVGALHNLILLFSLTQWHHDIRL